MTSNDEKEPSKSHGRKRENSEQSRLLARGYVECPACGKLTKPSLKRCSKCGRMMPRARNRLGLKLIAVAVVVILLSILFMSSGSEEPIVSPYVLAFSPTSTSASSSSPIMITFSRYMDQASVQSAFNIIPSVSGQFQWTGMKLVFSPDAPLSPGTTYEVRVGAGAKDLSDRGLDSSTFGWFFTTEGSSGMLRSLGNGVDTFWTSYPMGHPQSGSVVAHPQWVLDALQNGPVMILDHSTNCQPSWMSRTSRKARIPTGRRSTATEPLVLCSLPRTRTFLGDARIRSESIIRITKLRFRPWKRNTHFS